MTVWLECVPIWLGLFFFHVFVVCDLLVVDVVVVVAQCGESIEEGDIVHFYVISTYMRSNVKCSAICGRST